MNNEEKGVNLKPHTLADLIDDQIVQVVINYVMPNITAIILRRKLDNRLRS